MKRRNTLKPKPPFKPDGSILEDGYSKYFTNRYWKGASK